MNSINGISATEVKPEILYIPGFRYKRHFPTLLPTLLSDFMGFWDIYRKREKTAEMPFISKCCLFFNQPTGKEWTWMMK